jgi:serine/threonine-protein kinase
MDRADMHRALEKGYLATSARKDAMREVALLLKSDPSTANDAKVLEDVRNTAIGKEGSTEAFELLESDLGTAGVDLLYEIAHAQWAAEYPTAASRAQRALMKSDVRAKASPALDVAMDLRSAGSCDKKKALFPRIVETGDYRALAVLKTMTGTRGCGFLGVKDCFPCMHKDGSLQKTIAALDDRVGKKN